MLKVMGRIGWCRRVCKCRVAGRRRGTRRNPVQSHFDLSSFELKRERLQSTDFSNFHSSAFRATYRLLRSILQRLRPNAPMLLGSRNYFARFLKLRYQYRNGCYIDSLPFSSVFSISTPKSFKCESRHKPMFLGCEQALSSTNP